MGYMKRAYTDKFGLFPGDCGYDWLSTEAHRVGMPFPDWIEPNEEEVEAAHLDLLKQQMEAKCSGATGAARQAPK